jgi:thymidylate synthase
VTGDLLIERFGDPKLISEMKKVFFEKGSNSFGHSYAELMRGPGGQHDLEDVISLLRHEPVTKRAVVTICGEPNGKVPCLNVVQFLVRDGSVQTLYFARGQDAFKKFYADGLCVAAMAEKVATGLGISAGWVRGYIGSSHVYHEDMSAVNALLQQTEEHPQAAAQAGATRCEYC